MGEDQQIAYNSICAMLYHHNTSINSGNHRLLQKIRLKGLGISHSSLLDNVMDIRMGNYWWDIWKERSRKQGQLETVGMKV